MRLEALRSRRCDQEEGGDPGSPLSPGLWEGAEGGWKESTCLAWLPASLLWRNAHRAEGAQAIAVHVGLCEELACRLPQTNVGADMTKRLWELPQSRRETWGLGSPRWPGIPGCAGNSWELVPRAWRGGSDGQAADNLSWDHGCCSPVSVVVGFRGGQREAKAALGSEHKERLDRKSHQPGASTLGPTSDPSNTNSCPAGGQSLLSLGGWVHHALPHEGCLDPSLGSEIWDGTGWETVMPQFQDCTILKTLRFTLPLTLSFIISYFILLVLTHLLNRQGFLRKTRSGVVKINKPPFVWSSKLWWEILQPCFANGSYINIKIP